MRSRRGVVLLYHRVAGPRRDPQSLDVSVEHFHAHLDVLARAAVPIPLPEFEARRRAGTLPPRAVVVTFDDGYADNLSSAAPVLTSRRVPATIFVTAGMVGRDREFWWDDAERIAFTPAPLSGGVPGLAVSWSAADGVVRAGDGAPDRWSVQDQTDPTPRHRLYRALCAALYPLPADERDARLAEWRTWACVGAAARPSHRVVTREELRALAGTAGVTIGAHTMTHPVLSRLSPADQRRELEESGAWLAQAIARPVRLVAYPFGTRNEVSSATTRAAREAGFDGALANEPGAAWRWSSRWRLPRMLVRDWDASTFAQRLESWIADA